MEGKEADHLERRYINDPMYAVFCMIAFPMLRKADKIPPETRLPVQVQSV